ncbi:MAG: 30S ribosomal protein S7 [Nitrospinota bacterium]
MPRRREIPKRVINPDPKYDSVSLSGFMNVVMKKGKKSLAERLVYKALNIVELKTKKDPIEVFTKAMENVKPSLEVKSRRVGGSTYQVPMEVGTRRRSALAIRWIISSARKRSERGFENKLSGELIDAFNKSGASVRKKEESHKMAEANKAFSHYRW